MEFPEFQNDQEMAEWFEANNVEPESLEIADEVAVAPGLQAVLVAGIYEVGGARTTSNASSTVKGKRVLEYAAD